jgi:acetyl esterase/lipase
MYGLLATGVVAGGVARAGELSPVVLKLWNGDPPGMVKNAGEERTFPQWPDTVANVSVPTMAVYLPPKDKASGVALVYCSGGSYNKVSCISDDYGNADHFVPEGVALIVVKYRTTPPAAKDYSDALADAKRAVRIVRYRAKEWGIDPEKVGMLGGSAGAHLILSLATHADRGQSDAADPIQRESSRPDFLALLCPWPNNQPVSDFPINQQTPPALVCSARDDTIAPSAFAEGIVEAYKKAGAPAKLWLVETGGHTAFSPGNAGSGWTEQLWSWMRSLGMVAH